MGVIWAGAADDVTAGQYMLLDADDNDKQGHVM